MQTLVVNLFKTIPYITMDANSIVVAEDPHLHNTPESLAAMTEELSRASAAQSVLETTLIKAMGMSKDFDIEEALFVGADREQVEMFIRNTDFQTLFCQTRGRTAPEGQ